MLTKAILATCIDEKIHCFFIAILSTAISVSHTSLAIRRTDMHSLTPVHQPGTHFQTTYSHWTPISNLVFAGNSSHRADISRTLCINIFLLTCLLVKDFRF